MAIDSQENPWPWGDISSGRKSWNLPDNRELLVSREGNRLKTQIQDQADSDADPSEDYTIISEEENLFFRPSLPDRPVVLRPAHVLRIAPRNEMLTNVPVPLVPTIATRGKKGDYATLIRLPVSSLSKTWFGDPVSGEAAFSLNRPLDESDVTDRPDPWMALCPLTIKNESSEILSFERIILRVPVLSLYRSGYRLFTNRLTVRFRGQDQVSQIQIGPSAPNIGEKIVLFIGPQTKKDRLLLRRSFSFIKALAYG